MVRLSVARSFRSAGDKKKLHRVKGDKERERERDRVEVSTSAVGCIGACSLPNPAHHSEQRDHQSKV